MTVHRPYAPILIPPLMGPDLPSKSESKVHDVTDITYFQKYRIETLSKFSMPPYEWSMRGSQYSPEPYVDSKKQLRNINRYLTVIFNDISTIDVARMTEVDDVYRGIQMNRCQYKDRTGTMHPLAYFQRSSYMYQCAPGTTKSYCEKYPQNFIGYKTPIVLPLKRKEMIHIPDLSLTGIYSKGGCIAYKR